ncbi:LytTR family DNA-binding domain-containing protein [uncultured Pseudacidovorax sp.]|uniref:LytR/AlgR family response regulator transcription factor n=1 Tax=uncultured Pseudacidovorax sp. TaxID=679313 RepID=UPI0025D65B75|nr:LytTR family DNA-binding domain-containing protein [uncultured Pseudacidovorax sp.]
MTTPTPAPAGPAVVSTAAPLRVLVVDDEPLARARLRTLLAECRVPAAQVVGEAGDGASALGLLKNGPIDLLLLDIAMPGLDGMAVAQRLRAQPEAPVVVFVTAHAAHAVAAFDLDAADYLTKPVRAARLQEALARAERHLRQRRAAPPAADAEHLLIQERGRMERVPLADVLYLKAEWKYITVRTADRSLILDGSLNDLETRHAERFVRVHRNALVARHALRALERHEGDDEPEGWALRLAGLPEAVPVSRRQLPVVRDALRERAE